MPRRATHKGTEPLPRQGYPFFDHIPILLSSGPARHCPGPTAMPDAAVTTPKKRGPKTPEGKARSSRNALKHGLRARDFVLLPEEDPQEWTQHVLDLEARLRPGRRHREEAGRRHRRRDVEGDPRRPVRGRGADRHPAAQQGPQPRLRPAGARPRGGADHGDPLPGQCRHGAPAAPCAPSSSTGRPSRPDCCCRQPRARANPTDDKKHERIIGSAARPHPAAQPAARRPAATGRARSRRVAGRRAGGRGRSVRRIAAPLAAGDDRAPDPARDRDQGAAEEHRAADRRQRQRRLRGVVREAAEGAVRAGGPARKPQGRHRGGDQAQPALDARAVSLLLPPAGAGASVRPGLRQRRGAGGRAGRDRAAAGARPSRPCARGSPACSTAAPRGCPRSSTSPRRSAPSNGRNGRNIAARSISACCAGRWTAPSSTGRRSTGSAARRSCGSAGRGEPATACWAARGRAGGGRRRRS